MRYVFHIGPHKTGTTYLQLCFEANRDALRKRGILFPDLWAHAAGTPSQSGFSRRLVNGETALLVQELASVLTPDIHTVLISAESMSVLEAPALRELQSFVDGADVQFVFYVRRWSDLLPSAFQELVKQGSAKSLPEYAFENATDPTRSRLLNFCARIMPFTELFGKSSISYVCYSVLRDRQIDLFQHFARAFLSWNSAPTGSFKEPNVARTTEEIELLRTLNSLDRKSELWPASTLRNRFDQMRDGLDLSPIYSAMAPYRKTLTFPGRLGAAGSATCCVVQTTRATPRRPASAGKALPPEEGRSGVHCGRSTWLTHFWRPACTASSMRCKPGRVIIDPFGVSRVMHAGPALRVGALPETCV